MGYFGVKMRLQIRAGVRASQNDIIYIIFVAIYNMFFHVNRRTTACVEPSSCSALCLLSEVTCCFVSSACLTCLDPLLASWWVGVARTQCQIYKLRSHHLLVSVPVFLFNKRHSAAMPFCGPMARLRLGCLCLDSHETFYYQLADHALTGVPVRWLRRLGQVNLGQPVNASKDGSMKPPNAVINASLDIVDTSDGPAVRITSNKFVFADEDDGAVVAISDTIVLSKTCPLKSITSVGAGTFDEWARMGLLDSGYGEGRIMSTGVLIKFKLDSDKKDAKERVLVFEVRPPENGHKKHGLTRHEVVKHLNTMIDFERNRLGLPLLEGRGKEAQEPRGGRNSAGIDSREEFDIIPLDRTMSLNDEW